MNVREAVYRFSELKTKYETARKENEQLRAELAETREQLEKTEEKLKLVELTNTIIDKRGQDRTEKTDQ